MGTWSMYEATGNGRRLAGRDGGRGVRLLDSDNNKMSSHIMRCTLGSRDVMLRAHNIFTMGIWRVVRCVF
jgi:hypothetical protein